MSGARSSPRAGRRGRGGARVDGGSAALAVAAGLVVCAVLWGTFVVDRALVGLRAAPFAGRWEWHGGLRLTAALVVAGLTVWCGPRLAAGLRWRWTVLTTGATATAWTVALAASDGWDRLTAPLTTRHEYEPFAAGVDDLGGFLTSYVDRLGDHPIHVQGHPPGPVLVAWGLDRIGLGGAGWLALLAVAGWGVAAGATLVAARAVAGELPARRAAPFLALAPAAVWAGTSLDALFAGVVAAAVALTATGVARRSRWRLLAAGLVLGSALLLTYGAVPLLLIPAVVLLAGPGAGSGAGAPSPANGAGGTARLVGALATGIALALVVAGIAGFNWFEGLAATREAYWSGIASRRPAAYTTILSNPAVLAVAIGPAVVVGLADQVQRTVDRVRRGLAATHRIRGDGERHREVEVLVPAGGHHDLQPTAAVTMASGWSGQAPREAAVSPGDHPGTVAAASPPDRPGGGARGAGVRRSRTAMLPVAALAAVVTADLSQYTRGEVERIWLPFVPWLVLAAAPLGAAPHARRWLAAQAGVGLVVQAVLVSRW